MTIFVAQQNQIQNLIKEEQDWFVQGLEQQNHRFYDNKLPRTPGCATGDVR